MKATSKAINDYIARTYGAGNAFYRGEGYFYVSGPAFANAMATGIYTPRLNCQPLARWIADVDEIAARSKAEQDFSTALRFEIL